MPCGCSRPSFLPLLPLLALAASLGGCPGNEEPLRFRLVLAPTEFDCGDPASRTDFTWAGQDVRLTLLRREGPVNGARIRSYGVLCDKLFAGGPAEFDIPQRSGTVSIRVEVFNRQRDPAEGQLEFSGYRENADLSASEIQVVLRPAAPLGGMSCVERMRRSRAFHSATLLPNGQVLVVGGLVADRNGEGLATTLEAVEPAGIAASSVIEYYDPLTGAFRVIVPKGDALQPRAFHQAVLLQSPPAADGKERFQVLLLGGITPAAGRPAVWVKVSRPNYPFLLNPDTKAAAASPQLITIEPGAGTEGDPAVTVENVQGPPPVLFPVAGLFGDLDPDELMVGGGAGGHVGVFVNPDDTSIAPQVQPNRGFSNPTPAYWLELKVGSAGKPITPLARTRAGHAAARLDAERYLVWGGDMDGDGTDPVEVVQRKGDTAKVVGLGLATPPELTAWHTLTPIGGDDRVKGAAGAVLWAGGFRLKNDEPGVQLRIAEPGPRATPVHWLEGAPVPVLREVTTLPADHIGGYHEATRLADGSVLLSGGTAIAAGCKPGILCPSKLLAIFSRTSTGVELQTRPPVPQLGAARFGHRVVRLLDNTLLITGGIAKIDANEEKKEPEKLLFLNSNELYNPRRGLAAEDAPMFRDPGKDSGQSGIVGNRVCPSSTRGP